MTLKQAYEYGQKRLKDANIEDAVLDAWYLLEHVTGINRTMYYVHMDKKLSIKQEETYMEYLKTRAERVPLQHITGVQEFMGLEFCVNEHVLIPRQDTEVLVECVLDELVPGMEVLDMCTGSGCIVISLCNFRKGIVATGVDVSKEALKMAQHNVEKLKVDVRLIQSDLFSEVGGKFDVIVSNPPYIRTSVIEGLKEEVKFHDPYIALDGKEDGFFFYHKIIEESPKYLKHDGKLYFEIGHDQGETVKNLMEEAGFTEVTVKKDLAGLDRVVFGVYNK